MHTPADVLTGQLPQAQLQLPYVTDRPLPERQRTLAPSVCGNMDSTGLLPGPSELQQRFSKEITVRGRCGDSTTCAHRHHSMVK